MKSRAVLAMLLASAAPVLADGKPVKKPAVGDDYDCLQHKRDRRTNVPRTQDVAAKTTTVTEAMVAKVAKVRHGEIEYCWERLPQSQRVAGTAVLTFSIDPDGTVTDVVGKGDAPREATSCIADLAHRWTFPAVEGKSVVEYSIRLRDR